MSKTFGRCLYNQTGHLGPHVRTYYCEEWKQDELPKKKVDPILGCVIDEMPAARPGQGERYH